MVNSISSVVVALIGFMFMAVFDVNQAQEFAPSPAPILPSNDGAAIDQGIAYLLLLFALAITYLVH
ncbi:Arabinogalactan peptide, AGP [Cynara cardunculus var. scolymus]|uniref:Arabinogalactan peptide, AGP n=1 Tax=Cynara cardunculus var. scolymus TaxID=59895 RepID=A0A118JVL1_CYNCS|nr:Arabinogalactan peptide, AGP [Cynara cardunculus var. scolymus]